MFTLRKTALIVGTRPNIMKAVPVYLELKKQIIKEIGEKCISDYLTLVHTGQHYSRSLSGLFFEQLGVADDEIIYLTGYPRESHSADGFAWMIKSLFRWLSTNRIKKVVVFGDVNSTLAAALAASFLHLTIIHVEAGLRSYNSLMPEEKNRVMVDHLSDLLLTTEISAQQNLSREGLVAYSQHCGNTMIDTLVSLLPTIRNINIWEQMRLNEREYGVFTFHRQENVDSPYILRKVITIIDEIADEFEIDIIFPLHPRTRNALIGSDIRCSHIRVIEPLGYLEMMNLVLYCGILLTDSGGLQEEAAYLGVPTLTLREETERPITVTRGWNVVLSPKDDFFSQKLRRNIITKKGGRKLDLKDIREEMGEGKASQIAAKKILVC